MKAAGKMVVCERGVVCIRVQGGESRLVIADGAGMCAQRAPEAEVLNELGLSHICPQHFMGETLVRCMQNTACISLTLLFGASSIVG